MLFPIHIAIQDFDSQQIACVVSEHFPMANQYLTYQNDHKPKLGSR